MFVCPLLKKSSTFLVLVVKAAEMATARKMSRLVRFIFSIIIVFVFEEFGSSPRGNKLSISKISSYARNLTVNHYVIGMLKTEKNNVARKTYNIIAMKK